MEPMLARCYENIQEGNAKAVKENVQIALDRGIPATVILNEGMIDAMTEVGRRFEEGDYFVPEMLVAARAMQAGLGLLGRFLSRTMSSRSAGCAGHGQGRLA